jgi:Uma2 family endonuclease
MSVVSQPPSLPGVSLVVPTEPIWRLSVPQYHQMIQAGILTDDDPVELLEGWLIAKMPKNPPHRVATGLTRSALENHVPKGWYVDVQEPITLDDSEPEPDVTVVRGERRQYSDHHPGPRDLGLLVEVAEASLQRDRTSKKRVFARERIPVYWIVNLIDRQVEVFSDPSGPGSQPDYRQQHVYRVGDEVPVVIEGREIGRMAVRDLLP